jgi:hypothetical protein
MILMLVLAMVAIPAISTQMDRTSNQAPNQTNVSEYTALETMLTQSATAASGIPIVALVAGVALVLGAGRVLT